MSARGEITGFRFDRFEIDLKNRLLKSSQGILPLNSKYFDVLVLLVKNHHQLISKQAIFDQVWRDTIVTDSALSQCIKDIRKTLGDEAHNPRFIKTVAKHGYMFIADVTPVFAEDKPKKNTTVLIRPYKFLDYYSENDQNLFFGREREVEMVTSKILAHRNFILHGRSGVGKSSLIRAGIIPALKELGHQTFIIRSFSDPLEQLINQLIEKGKLPATFKEDDLVSLMRRIADDSSDKLLIFFFDQFEDFFLQLNKAQQAHFREQIQQVFASVSLPVRLVFVLREDLLAEMSFFKPVIPEIFHHEFRLLKLSADQAIQAILKPAQAVGCPFEKALAQQILQDLSNGQNDIDPPQLQIVCDALFDARDPQKGITRQQYETLGRASRILENYMERVLNRFDARDALLAKKILKLLISEDFQRVVIPLQEIIHQLAPKGEDQKRIRFLINELSDARLVRLGRQESMNWVELSHDFLIPKIKEWLSDEEQKLRRARLMVQNAMENYKNHGILLDEDSLQILLPFGAQLELTDEQIPFVARSLIFRRYVLPDWIKNATPDLPQLIEEAMRSGDPGIRLCAVESCLGITRPAIKEILNHTSLWDSDWNVRKAASIVFVKNFGNEAQARLASGKNHRKAGLVRRAISLSFVRDHDINLVYLRKLPLPVALLVVTGLILVRLQRHRKQIIREISGATLGATGSGLLFGSFLGAALAIARHAPTFETLTYLLSLISLAGFASFFGGLGIATGLVLMRYVTYRHSQWWIVIGGTVGGLMMGALINVIGMDILRTLFGQQLIKITGAFEASILGFCISLGVVIAERFFTRAKVAKIIVVAVTAMIGAISLSLLQGNLFSGSIAAITRSFANAQINLSALTTLFGEGHFGLISRMILGSLEGFLFGGFFMAGLVLFTNKDKA